MRSNGFLIFTMSRIYINFLNGIQYVRFFVVFVNTSSTALNTIDSLKLPVLLCFDIKIGLDLTRIRLNNESFLDNV